VHIEFLKEIFREKEESDAVAWNSQTWSYRWLLDKIDQCQQTLHSKSIAPGTVVILEADFSPNSIAILLSLVELGCIVAPVSGSSGLNRNELIETSQGEIFISVNGADTVKISKLSNRADHKLYEQLRNRHHPGLILFSSGSTGKSKAAVHDFSSLLYKFQTRRHDLRTLAFLLFDHIGGIDTMLYCLSNGSCLVTAEDRATDSVCAAIEQFNVEVLPVSPTFLNLLFLSQAHERHDLSSLKYITYGTEIMPQATLERCAELFPGVKILQKYGTTEVGTLHSRSKGSDSVWVEVGGDGFQTRVIDDILQIKARSAMLGYLNSPSPFTDDGWFITGDRVEVDGQYLKIMGRETEIINVGGEKVFPAEVESVVQGMDNVAEVTVYGEKNPIMGNIVCAKVRLARDENHREFTSRLKKHCRATLQDYKVPIKIRIDEAKQHSHRFKKMRAGT